MDTSWTSGSYISLPEILDAREHRAEIQQELLSKNPACLLSFTLNIAGPVKVTPLTKWLYQLGNTLIQTGIRQLQGTILEQREEKENTGWEGFFALNLPPETIKSYLIEQELNHPLGRLFDFDVLRPNGSKVSRQELGFPERTCLICGKPAFLCGRSRTHSAKELQEKTNEMIQEQFVSSIASQLGILMHRALIAEVKTTLKPGLVDQIHNGSHKDMNLDTFLTSADTLTYYFVECVKSGLLFEGTKEELPNLFLQLRTLGIQAEASMLTATNGINTHKGIIFSGGIFCGALGYLISNHGVDLKPEDLLEQLGTVCRNMLSHLLDDYRHITSDNARTHGEKLYVQSGITGIRGEAANGFPHVLKEGYSIFSETIKKGYSQNDAGLAALLYYIGNTEDTNMIARSDLETARKIQKNLLLFLKNTTVSEQLAILPELDQYFVKKNISPGGSADMLALTYFIYFLFDNLKNRCYNAPLLQ